MATESINIHKFPGLTTHRCNRLRKPLIDFPIEQHFDDLVASVAHDIQNGKFDTIPYVNDDNVKMVPLNFVEAVMKKLMNK